MWDVEYDEITNCRWMLKTLNQIASYTICFYITFIVELQHIIIAHFYKKINEVLDMTHQLIPKAPSH